MGTDMQAISKAENQSLWFFGEEKYTNYPLIPSLIIALAGGAISFAIAYIVKDIASPFSGLLLERGPIQFVIVFSFWFSLGMFFFKYRNIKREKQAFQLDYLKRFTKEMDIVGTETMILEFQGMEENTNNQETDLILIRRINKALKQIRINNNPSDVSDVLNSVAKTDSAIIDSSYIYLKFMIWAIPVLGFIGTIMGMTKAMGSFDLILKGINKVGLLGIKESLGQVSSGLAVAFETTFLALILSVILNLISNAMQKQEEDLLTDIEQFTTDNIVNKYSKVRDHLKHNTSVTAMKPMDPQFTEEIQVVVRELKNMNRQNQVFSDQILEQIGHVIETIRALPKEAPDEKQPTDLKQIESVLSELGDIIRKQTEFMKQIGVISEFVKNNIETLKELPAALSLISETNNKLGELMGKIYNRPF